MNKIEDIASVHLGKAGDGTVVKPYITPDKISPELLVRIPRSLNREQFGITDNAFVGVDVWNCYEVSFFAGNNPATYVAKIAYPSNSEYIVESKSLKLYLNSFNMDMIYKEDAINKIRKDLSDLLVVDVNVYIHSRETVLIGNLPKRNLSRVDNSFFVFDHLRSNCRVTNQPDWGDVYVALYGENYDSHTNTIFKMISEMRNQNHFHEEICEKLFIQIREVFSPKEMTVACFYTRRGGIDINPIRASSKFALSVFDNGYYSNVVRLSEKTMKQ
jgi:7-cyano-7-deazaguanine reductase